MKEGEYKGGIKKGECLIKRKTCSEKGNMLHIGGMNEEKYLIKGGT